MRLRLHRCWTLAAAAAWTSRACSRPDHDAGPLGEFGALEGGLAGGIL